MHLIVAACMVVGGLVISFLVVHLAPGREREDAERVGGSELMR